MALKFVIWFLIEFIPLNGIFKLNPLLFVFLRRPVFMESLFYVGVNITVWNSALITNNCFMFNCVLFFIVVFFREIFCQSFSIIAHTDVQVVGLCVFKLRLN